MRYRDYVSAGIAFVILAMLTNSCKEDKKQGAVAIDELVAKELDFVSRKIIDSVNHVWAYVPAEVTGDGIVDIVMIDKNSSGGPLVYFEGQKEDGLWQRRVIAEIAPNGSLFAGGDLEAADIDGDGDTDVLGIAHPGEWVDAGATAYLVWYENDDGNWLPHEIGEAPDAVKDVSFEDFNKDGKIDLAVLTFDEHTLSIFEQNGKSDWSRVQFITNEALHEGMHVGDLNGDGFADIVATAFAFYNPGEDSSEPWKSENIVALFNNQEGDWSRNGTKAFISDNDDDGIAEVYLSHSERAGYPLASYKKNSEMWEATIIKDSIMACHTLQVFDFDLDGDLDVLAGINKDRAVNLGGEEFEVALFLNEGDYRTYKTMALESTGIYNGQAADYDEDGDIDIFRYAGHEAAEFYIIENTIQ